MTISWALVKLFGRKPYVAQNVLMLNSEHSIQSCSSVHINCSKVGVNSGYRARCQLWCCEMTVLRLDFKVISPNLYWKIWSQFKGCHISSTLDEL